MRRTIAFLLFLPVIFSCRKDNEADTMPTNGEEIFDCTVDTTFTDPRDGQTYEVIRIGNQCWFAENLRYNPPNMLEVVSQDDWSDIWNGGIEQPAWCYYDNNPANDTIFGKLYNWYAAIDESLCPEGWHIPSDEEWKTLELELGMSTDEVNDSLWRGNDQNVGGKMKTIADWTAPNNGATNESGFYGLPAGNRNVDGFLSINGSGSWWSTSEADAGNAWYRLLINFRMEVLRLNRNKAFGFSCRCVKD